VFESFRQADSSTRRSYGGLGLGLAIARHIVVAHGGQIEANSEGAGWGTTITVELPADVSPEPPPPRPSARSVAGGPFAALSGAKVLFVDDDSAARELAELVLGAHGATVMSAGSVDLALELAPAFLPDAIVSDVAMPHRDGYDLIREVRKLPGPVGTVPALAVTAYARAEDARRALDAGFTMHLAKPSGPDELSAAVCELLERR
jgi:CheY-like chemotaxis protein